MGVPFEAPLDFQLYDFQEFAVNKLRAGIAKCHEQNKGIMLDSPTGSGKTEIAIDIAKKVIEKGLRVMFLVDRLTLLDQTYKRFAAHGIECGILGGGQARGLHLQVIIAVEQTLERRKEWPDVDLIIKDEAHVRRQKIADGIKAHRAMFLGLSATPFTKGLAEDFYRVVTAATTNQLIDQGFLAPVKVYSMQEIDMSNAKTSGGEWTDKEADRCGRKIIGDIVSTWEGVCEKEFQRPVKTIVFVPTVDYGEDLCQMFKDAGYRFEVISYKDPDEDRRRAIIEAFERGEIMGLISVEALAKGFDVKDVLMQIAARPLRKSLAAHLQMLGRVMRTAPGKEYAVVIDHCGNYAGFYEDMQEYYSTGCTDLNDEKWSQATRKERDKKDRSCPSCKRVVPIKAGQKHCPFCGADLHKRKTSVIEWEPGKCVEVPGIDGGADADFGGDIWPAIAKLAHGRHPKDFDKRLKWARAQYRNITGGWPKDEGRFIASRGNVNDVQVPLIVRKRVDQNYANWKRKTIRESKKATKARSASRTNGGVDVARTMQL